MGISRRKVQIAEKIIESERGVHMVPSGAGVGKTEFLKYLVKTIVENDSRAKILFLGFAKTTVGEGSRRIKLEKKVTYATCHSYGYNLLKDYAGYEIPYKYIDCMGYTGNIIIDDCPYVLAGEEPVSRTMIDVVVSNGNAKPMAKLIKQAQEYLRKCYAKQEKVPLEWRDPKIDEIIRQYVEHKAENGIIDYDDMIVLPWALLKSDKAIQREVSNRYTYILLDEAQDINNWQRDLILWTKGNKTKLVMVGDPCQLAYGSFGATLDLFPSVRRENKGNVKIYRISTSRRCPDTICSLSNAITDQLTIIEKTKIKPLKANLGGKVPEVIFHQEPNGGVQFVVDEIGRLIEGGHDYSDIVVLVRCIRGERAYPIFCKLIGEFKKNGIPAADREKMEREFFRYDLFYQAIAVAIDDYEDEDLIATAGLLGGIGVREAKRHLRGERNKEITKLIRELQKLKHSSITKIVSHVASICNQFGKVDQEVLNYFRGFGSVEELVDQWDHVESYFNQENQVTISTIHSFKGREKTFVFLLGVDDLSIPFRTKDFRGCDDEERCLLNIAVTRTKQKLYMTCVDSVFRNSLSKFLFPLKDSGLFKLKRIENG